MVMTINDKLIRNLVVRNGGDRNNSLESIDAWINSLLDVVPFHAMKSYRHNADLAPLFLNLGIRW